LHLNTYIQAERSHRTKAARIKKTETERCMLYALSFGVNGGRIAEIATSFTFEWVEPATGELPPPGPYPRGRGRLAHEPAERTSSYTRTTLGKWSRSGWAVIPALVRSSSSLSP
jgi:hypothetical protein